MLSESELSAFSSSNADKDIDVVYMIANTSCIVLQSRRFVHNTTSSCHAIGYFGRPTFWPTIFETKITTFRRYKIANFFQTQFKLWDSILKMLNFQNNKKTDFASYAF